MLRLGDDQDSREDQDKKTDPFEDMINRNYKPGEEDQAEAAARDGADEDRAAKDIGKREGLYNPTDRDSGKSADRNELADKETNSGSSGSGKETIRGNLNKLAEGGEPGGFKRFAKNMVAKKNRKKAGIVLVAGGGLAGIGIAGMVFLGPLKLMHVVSNLQDEFFAASDDASDRMGRQMLNHYIIRKVIPGMHANRGCNSTLTDKSCAAVANDAGPLGALWMAWRDNNFEGKLAKEHGLEIRKSGGKYYLHKPGLVRQVYLGELAGTSKNDIAIFGKTAFVELNRSEVRRQMNAAYDTESRGKGMRQRHNLGKLLERKYGIRRCVIACDTRDRWADKAEHRRNALKLIMVERYILPQSEMMGLAIQCALNDFKCAEPGDPNQDGERESEFRRDVRVGLQQYRRTHGTNEPSDLQKEADRVRQYGVTGYIVRRVAGDAAGSVLGKIFGKALPVIGWIDTVNSIYTSAKNAGPAIKHMTYTMGSALAVAHMATVLTAQDEFKTGKIDPEAFGSLSQIYDAKEGSDQGGAPMEAAPLAGYINTGGSTNAATVFDYFNPRVYAAGVEPNKEPAYPCDDGKGVPAGSLVCPVMGVGALSTLGQIASKFSEVLNNPALSPINAVSAAWNYTIGAAINWFFGKVGQGLAMLLPEIEMPAVVKWISDNLIKPFFVDQRGDNPSGAREYEISAYGMNQMGIDEAQYVQGGKVLTASEAASIAYSRDQARQEEFAAKPLYARLFDTQDNHSMVSRMALSVPTTGTGAMSRVGSILSDPLSSVSRSFSAIFATRKASAMAAVSPFGLKQTGYPINHEVFQQDLDLDQYWKDKNCDNPDLIKEWGAKATEMDPDTYMPLQYTTEPCMLIRSEIAARGGALDKSLLLPDPSATGGTTSPTPTGGTGIPSGDTVALANQIVTHDNISFQNDAREAEFRRIIANGGKAPVCGSPTISPILLGVILKLAESYKLVLGNFVEGRGGDCGGYHGKGMAVDINGVNPLNGGQGTGNRIGDPEPSGPSDPFGAAEQPILKEFWSLAGTILAPNGGGALGQHQCFTNPLPSRSTGVLYFNNDRCDHIHLDVR